MRSGPAWIALTAALAVELVLGVFLLVTMFPTLPAAGLEREVFFPLWVSLLVSMAICCVWIAATLLGAIRRRGSWVRGSAVTIHVLMFAAALGVFQGLLGTPAIGIALLVLALVGFVSAILTGTLDRAPGRGTGAPGDGEAGQGSTSAPSGA